MKTETFRAFKNRNYALYFSGQSVSLIGTWIQRTAVSWVIYTMTGSLLMLGVTAFAQQIPSSLLSLYGGIVADRYNRYKILLVTQIASMVQAVLLATLVLTNHYNVATILGLSVMLGVINAFDVPARQPLVHELINNKDDLPNAVAFNSSMVNLARIIGPSLSGIALKGFGAGICFLLNALSFIAVLTSLLLMKLPEYMPRSEKKKLAKELTEGFTYIKNTPIIAMILLILAMMSFFVLPYDTLLPAFAKVIYKGDAATYGYVRSFIGVGAMGGALFLASLKKGADLKFILLVNSIILGIGLICFSHISNFWGAMVFAVVSGFGTMSQTTICITIVQVHMDKLMRGRVMGYVALAFFGMMPLGSLLLGAVSEKIGAPDAILCEGIAAIIISLTFSGFLRKDRLNRKEMEEFPEAEDMAGRRI